MIMPRGGMAQLMCKQMQAIKNGSHLSSDAERALAVILL